MTLDEIKAVLCKGEYSSFGLHWNDDSSTNYQTVAAMLQEQSDYYRADDFVGGAAEKERCCQINSLWTAHWYPETPIGFNSLHAATYDKLHAALEALCGANS